MDPPGRMPRVFIAATAFKRLKWYIDLCPFEVGGLGIVEPFGEDLLVADTFLLRQRASNSDTELDAQAVLDHLLRCAQEGGDLSSLRVWWHSHAEGDIHWSDTDEQTIEAMQIDQLISIVGNKRHEFGCRLDRFRPERATVDGLPLIPISDAEGSEDESLRQEIMAELREKVTLIVRETPIEHELVFDPSSTVEFEIPFQEDWPPTT
ncbi:MAG: hypothetical protein L0Y78_01835 [candidate division NC10 bacterium]|nr:hypothetical protein [candidate division NC10 bacterium]